MSSGKTDLPDLWYFQYPQRIVSQWNSVVGIVAFFGNGFQYPQRIVSQ